MIGSSAFICPSLVQLNAAKYVSRNFGACVPELHGRIEKLSPPNEESLVTNPPRRYRHSTRCRACNASVIRPCQAVQGNRGVTRRGATSRHRARYQRWMAGKTFSGGGPMVRDRALTEDGSSE